VFGYHSWSLIFYASKLVKKLFSLKTQMTDTAAKKLAASFGLCFVLLMSIFSDLHLDKALYITSTILLICSSLEVVFNYCLGCEIYHIYKKLKPIKSTQRNEKMKKIIIGSLLTTVALYATNGDNMIASDVKSRAIGGVENTLSNPALTSYVYKNNSNISIENSVSIFN